MRNFPPCHIVPAAAACHPRRKRGKEGGIFEAPHNPACNAIRPSHLAPFAAVQKVPHLLERIITCSRGGRGSKGKGILDGLNAMRPSHFAPFAAVHQVPHLLERIITCRQQGGKGGREEGVLRVKNLRWDRGRERFAAVRQVTHLLDRIPPLGPYHHLQQGEAREQGRRGWGGVEGSGGEREQVFSHFAPFAAVHQVSHLLDRIITCSRGRRGSKGGGDGEVWREVGGKGSKFALTSPRSLLSTRYPTSWTVSSPAAGGGEGAREEGMGRCGGKWGGKGASLLSLRPVRCCPPGIPPLGPYHHLQQGEAREQGRRGWGGVEGSGGEREQVCSHFAPFAAVHQVSHLLDRIITCSRGRRGSKGGGDGEVWREVGGKGSKFALTSPRSLLSTRYPTSWTVSSPAAGGGEGAREEGMGRCGGKWGGKGASLLSLRPIRCCPPGIPPLGPYHHLQQGEAREQGRRGWGGVEGSGGEREQVCSHFAPFAAVHQVSHLLDRIITCSRGRRGSKGGGDGEVWREVGGKGSKFALTSPRSLLSTRYPTSWTVSSPAAGGGEGAREEGMGRCGGKWGGKGASLLSLRPVRCCPPGIPPLGPYHHLQQGEAREQGRRGWGGVEGSGGEREQVCSHFAPFAAVHQVSHLLDRIITCSRGRRGSKGGGDGEVWREVGGKGSKFALTSPRSLLSTRYPTSWTVSSPAAGGGEGAREEGMGRCGGKWGGKGASLLSLRPVRCCPPGIPPLGPYHHLQQGEAREQGRRGWGGVEGSGGEREQVCSHFAPFAAVHQVSHLLDRIITCSRGRRGSKGGGDGEVWREVGGKGSKFALTSPRSLLSTRYPTSWTVSSPAAGGGEGAREEGMGRCGGKWGGKGASLLSLRPVRCCPPGIPPLGPYHHLQQGEAREQGRRGWGGVEGSGGEREQVCSHFAPFAAVHQVSHLLDRIITCSRGRRGSKGGGDGEVWREVGGKGSKFALTSPRSLLSTRYPTSWTVSSPAAGGGEGAREEGMGRCGGKWGGKGASLLSLRPVRCCPPGIPPLGPYHHLQQGEAREQGRRGWGGVEGSGGEREQVCSHFAPFAAVHQVSHLLDRIITCSRGRRGSKGGGDGEVWREAGGKGSKFALTSPRSLLSTRYPTSWTVSSPAAGGGEGAREEGMGRCGGKWGGKGASLLSLRPVRCCPPGIPPLGPYHHLQQGEAREQGRRGWGGVEGSGGEREQVCSHFAPFAAVHQVSHLLDRIITCSRGRRGSKGGGDGEVWREVGGKGSKFALTSPRSLLSTRYPTSWTVSSPAAGGGEGAREEGMGRCGGKWGGKGASLLSLRPVRCCPPGIPPLGPYHHLQQGEAREQGRRGWGGVEGSGGEREQVCSHFAPFAAVHQVSHLLDRIITCIRGRRGSKGGGDGEVWREVGGKGSKFALTSPRSLLSTRYPTSWTVSSPAAGGGEGAREEGMGRCGGKWGGKGASLLSLRPVRCCPPGIPPLGPYHHLQQGEAREQGRRGWGGVEGSGGEREQVCSHFAPFAAVHQVSHLLDRIITCSRGRRGSKGGGDGEVWREVGGKGSKFALTSPRSLLSTRYPTSWTVSSPAAGGGEGAREEGMGRCGGKWGGKGASLLSLRPVRCCPPGIPPLGPYHHLQQGEAREQGRRGWGGVEGSGGEREQVCSHFAPFAAVHQVSHLLDRIITCSRGRRGSKGGGDGEVWREVGGKGSKFALTSPRSLLSTRYPTSWTVSSPAAGGGEGAREEGMGRCGGKWGGKGASLLSLRPVRCCPPGIPPLGPYHHLQQGEAREQGRRGWGGVEGSGGEREQVCSHFAPFAAVHQVSHLLDRIITCSRGRRGSKGGGDGEVWREVGGKGSKFALTSPRSLLSTRYPTSWTVSSPAAGGGEGAREEGMGRCGGKWGGKGASLLSLRPVRCCPPGIPPLGPYHHLQQGEAREQGRRGWGGVEGSGGEREQVCSHFAPFAAVHQVSHLLDRIITCSRGRRGSKGGGDGEVWREVGGKGSKFALTSPRSLLSTRYPTSWTVSSPAAGGGEGAREEGMGRCGGKRGGKGASLLSLRPVRCCPPGIPPLGPYHHLQQGEAREQGRRGWGGVEGSGGEREQVCSHFAPFAAVHQVSHLLDRIITCSRGRRGSKGGGDGEVWREVGGKGSKFALTSPRSLLSTRYPTSWTVSSPAAGGGEGAREEGMGRCGGKWGGKGASLLSLRPVRCCPPGIPPLGPYHHLQQGEAREQGRRGWGGVEGSGGEREQVCSHFAPFAAVHQVSHLLDRIITCSRGRRGSKGGGDGEVWREVGGKGSKFALTSPRSLLSTRYPTSWTVSSPAAGGGEGAREEGMGRCGGKWGGKGASLLSLRPIRCCPPGIPPLGPYHHLQQGEAREQGRRGWGGVEGSGGEREQVCSHFAPFAAVHQVSHLLDRIITCSRGRRGSKGGGDGEVWREVGGKGSKFALTSPRSLLSTRYPTSWTVSSPAAGGGEGAREEGMGRCGGKWGGKGASLLSLRPVRCCPPGIPPLGPYHHLQQGEAREQGRRGWGGVEGSGGEREQVCSHFAPFAAVHQVSHLLDRIITCSRGRRGSKGGGDGEVWREVGGKGSKFALTSPRSLLSTRYPTSWTVSSPAAGGGEGAREEGMGRCGGKWGGKGASLLSLRPVRCCPPGIPPLGPYHHLQQGEAREQGRRGWGGVEGSGGEREQVCSHFAPFAAVHQVSHLLDRIITCSKGEEGQGRAS
ncbi:unnamed protein product [Closterium sp. Naga37s-1]|nr:unnamed protein product [Closterium sp. Naga37s-1]